MPQKQNQSKPTKPAKPAYNYDWAEPVYRELEKAGFTPLEQRNIIWNLMAESKGKLVDEVGNKSKYRGRGYIQLTTLNNYKHFGKLLGIDLENNPELANDPEIAAKIVPLFYAENKKWRKIKGNYEDFDNVVKATAPEFYKKEGDSIHRINKLKEDGIEPPLLREPVKKPIEKKVAMDEPMEQLPRLSLDANGMQSFDVRPSDA
jgi:hypothetical protein